MESDSQPARNAMTRVTSHCSTRTRPRPRTRGEILAHNGKSRVSSRDTDTPAGVKEPEDFTFRFTPIGDGPPLAIRVRRMLKSALRHYGLRAEWALKLEPLIAGKARENQRIAGGDKRSDAARPLSATLPKAVATVQNGEIHRFDSREPLLPISAKAVDTTHRWIIR